jgi:FixJ family two-component response regulator
MIESVDERVRIAVIDDDLSVRSAVSRLLRSHHYSCKAYESAENALTDPDFTAANCLVIDVQLVGMSGFAFRDRLQEKGVRIPYLFITAHAETGSAEWIRAVGGSPLVIKPFDEGQLLEAIETAVKSQEQQPTT